MNEGHGTGPQLVGQLTEDDPIGQSLSQVLRQGPLQPGLKDLGAEERGPGKVSGELTPAPFLLREVTRWEKRC
jgi:hypothetical protein